jgi:hypothetical protein
MACWWMGTETRGGDRVIGINLQRGGGTGTGWMPGTGTIGLEPEDDCNNDEP